jgi:hypothetical protein
MAQDTNKPETGKMAFTLLTKKGNRQQVSPRSLLKKTKKKPNFNSRFID